MYNGCMHLCKKITFIPLGIYVPFKNSTNLCLYEARFSVKFNTSFRKNYKVQHETFTAIKKS